MGDVVLQQMEIQRLETSAKNIAYILFTDSQDNNRLPHGLRTQ